MTKDALLDKIMYFVERDELNVKGRQREKIYKKCFLMNKMYEFKFTLMDIGSVFNQHHSSVIHNIKTHNDMMHFNYEHYDQHINEYMEEFKNIFYTEPIRNLAKDVMQCDSILHLRQIKKWILAKKYNKYQTFVE